MDYPLASCHKEPGFKTAGGYLCETRILLLALSLYMFSLFLEKINAELLWNMGQIGQYFDINVVKKNRSLKLIRKILKQN